MGAEAKPGQTSKRRGRAGEKSVASCSPTECLCVKYVFVLDSSGHACRSAFKVDMSSQSRASLGCALCGESMEPAAKVTKVRVDKLAANIVGTLLTLVLCGMAILLAHLLPHYSPPAEWHLYAFLGSSLVLMPVHEALHAMGLIWFGGVSWRDIRFGVMWRALMPYCHCTVPITISAHRRMALLPLIVTGLVTITALLIYPTDWLGGFTGVTIGACVGDIWLVVKLRPFPGAFLVQDSPTEIGCDVYSENQRTAA